MQVICRLYPITRYLPIYLPFSHPSASITKPGRHYGSFKEDKPGKHGQPCSNNLVGEELNGNLRLEG
jgi:hypothetical protein